MDGSAMTLPYSASSRRSFTTMASIALARSTAVLHASDATGAAVVVLEPCLAAVAVGPCVGDEARLAPASTVAGRSSNQATAPTATPPTNATAGG